MINSDRYDGTLSTAMSKDGTSPLPKDNKDEIETKPAPSGGGEDEASTAKDGKDDHLKEDQKPTKR